LGIACVISRAGVNIAEAEAKAYIAGLTIAAGWVLRDLQRVEASLGLGPSKSQDFAISLGPYIVTLDELKGAEEGNRHKLGGTVSVNGREFTCASLSSAHWTFPQMVEVASRDAPLYPGDILATGAVPGGSLLTSRRDGPWLQPGDVVRFQVESLGTLTNNVE
jgi:fumarylacetoacetate (FAA) hydrolase